MNEDEIFTDFCNGVFRECECSEYCPDAKKCEREGELDVIIHE